MHVPSLESPAKASSMICQQKPYISHVSLAASLGSPSLDPVKISAPEDGAYDLCIWPISKHAHLSSTVCWLPKVWLERAKIAQMLPAMNDDISTSPCQVERSMLADAVCAACHKISFILQAASFCRQTCIATEEPLALCSDRTERGSRTLHCSPERHRASELVDPQGTTFEKEQTHRSASEEGLYEAACLQALDANHARTW